jgi:prolyl-tRNA editing enzyme YbaK/EbsC (Cys-tRNA(Pro) deacylase)
MAINRVRTYLKRWNKDTKVQEFDASSSTVPAAALALGVEEARIAKSLAFKLDDGAVMVVAAVDDKVDNRAYKAQFGKKAKMLTPEETTELTSLVVGGVCPFDVPPTTKVYLDVSLQRFDTIFPACGTAHSAIELTCDELHECSQSLGWVDVCKNWRSEE